MLILAAALLGLLALANLAGALGMLTGADGIQLHTLPVVVYAFAALTVGAATVLTLTGPRDAVLWVALLGAVLTCSGPLLYGRAVGEFHLSHHLVRLVIVTVVLGFLVWTLHR